MSSPPKPRIRGSLADRLEIFLPLLGYVVVVLAKLSTSSLGSASLRGANPHGWSLGSPLAIRSDEWLTETPLELGVLIHGSPVCLSAGKWAQPDLPIALRWPLRVIAVC
ncbi:MAG: hypothetical protein V9G13_12285 [Marmoricola sp.]